MNKFIIVTFGVLAWTFYEMSGGADFVPEARATSVAAVEVEPEADAPIAVAETIAEEADDPALTFAVAEVPRAADQPIFVAAAPAAEPVPATDDAGPEEVFLFQSLVEGAPTAEDTLTPNGIVATSAPADTAPVAEAPEIDLRFVAGSRVNMRDGPGVAYPVLDTLSAGAEVVVLETRNGWARLRATASGSEGWMAERLLSDG